MVSLDEHLTIEGVAAGEFAPDGSVAAIGGGGYRGVFVESAKADFYKLFEILMGER